MERLKKMWNSFRTFVSRTMQEHPRIRTAVAVGTAAVLVGVGTAVYCHRADQTGSGKQETGAASAGQSQEHSVRKDDPPDGDEEGEPPSRIPSGYMGVIEGVLSTKGLTKNYRALGTSCEIVLVGQRLIPTEVVSRLDVSSRLVQSVNALDDKSWELAGTTRMSDKDYENLLAIVEAESGGEDLEGRIMVANVILNRVASDEFPDDVTSVVWQRSGGSPQFSPTADGRIHTVTITDATREAVNRAIDGEDLSQGALYFLAKHQADPDNIEWFDSHLTFLFEHGLHSFYE